MAKQFLHDVSFKNTEQRSIESDNDCIRYDMTASDNKNSYFKNDEGRHTAATPVPWQVLGSV